MTKPMGNLQHIVGKGKELDLGEAIHAHIGSNAGTSCSAQCFVFPSMIIELVLQQLPELLTKREKMYANSKAFTYDHKLYVSTIINDLDKVVQFKNKVVVVPVKQKRR